jgi:protein-tyrosine-phosphatase
MAVTLGLVVFLVCACAKPSGPAPVLLVCEHGSVKSLMAASMFNQAAAERGLPFRALSRGVTPDEQVPAKIAEALGREGFDVQSFKPVRVSSDDLDNASRVVAISIDPSTFASGAKVPVEHWDDVPAASVDYAAAHAALQRHVEQLLEELQAATR